MSCQDKILNMSVLYMAPNKAFIALESIETVTGLCVWHNARF